MNLRFSHGLSVADYEGLLAQQKGVCAVCQQVERGLNQYGPLPLAVDHCHETGRIRGLLCMLCNRAAGFLRHDPARIRALADYLENEHAHVFVRPHAGLP